MAVTIRDTETYNGSYVNVHTLPDLDCTGSNTYALAVGINRDPISEVSSWTFEGATPDAISSRVESSTVAVQVMGDIVSDGDLTIISNTPSYKLQSMIGLALEGVDPTTPIVGTPVTASNYGSSITASYTGTSGNMLFVFISTQGDKTFTASSCTEASNVTNPDSNLGSGFVGYVTATGSSQTIGATWTGDTVAVISIIEVEASTDSLTLDVAHISSNAIIYSPSLTTGAVSLTLPHITATTSLYILTVSVQSVSLTTSYIASSTNLYNPTVSPQVVSATLPFIASSANLFSPTLTQTNGLYLPVISSSVALHSGSVTTGAVTIEVVLISSTNVLTPPSVSVFVDVSAPYIASSSQLFTPQELYLYSSLLPPSIGLTSSLFAPAVTTGEISVTTPLITSSTSLFQLELTLGAVMVLTPHLSSTTSVYVPEMLSDIDSVYVSFISSSNYTYAMSLSTALYGLEKPKMSQVPSKPRSKLEASSSTMKPLMRIKTRRRF